MENCCSTNPEKTEKNLDEKGGQTKMGIEKIILWIIIAVLAIAVIYVLFLRGPTTGGNVVSSAGQVVRQASSGMVGGC